MPRIDYLVALVSCLLVLTAGCAARSNELAGRIAAVEQSLIPAVVKAEAPPPLLEIEARMRHFNVPGVSLAVVNNGAVEWAKGYGGIEAGGARAVDANTLFQACSISKPVGVTGIMLLAQNGRLDIDRDVNHYLGSWQLPDTAHTASEKPTVARLMSHTGGTSVGGFQGYPAGETLPSLLQTLQGQPPANNPPVTVTSTPGSHWSYSGGGMEVLHLLARDVTGMPFHDYQQRNLFAPLGMTRSLYTQPLAGALAENAARGHDADGVTVPGGWHAYPELVAAGLWTTPTDLGRLLVEMMRASQGQGRVLAQETADAILTRRPHSEFGLGFMVSPIGGDVLFQHSGSNHGYKTHFMGFRDRRQGVLVLTNGDNGTQLMFEIVRSVGRVYGWPPVEQAETAELVELPLAVLRSLVGSYAGTYQPPGESDSEAMTFQVYLEGGGLMLRHTFAHGTGRTDLYPVAPDRCLVRGELPGTLTFEVDAQGQATGFRIPEQGVVARRE